MTTTVGQVSRRLFLTRSVPAAALTYGSARYFGRSRANDVASTTRGFTESSVTDGHMTPEQLQALRDYSESQGQSSAWKYGAAIGLGTALFGIATSNAEVDKENRIPESSLSKYLPSRDKLTTLHNRRGFLARGFFASLGALAFAGITWLRNPGGKTADAIIGDRAQEKSTNDDATQQLRKEITDSTNTRARIDNGLVGGGLGHAIANQFISAATETCANHHAACNLVASNLCKNDDTVELILPTGIPDVDFIIPDTLRKDGTRISVRQENSRGAEILYTTTQRNSNKPCTGFHILDISGKPLYVPYPIDAGNKVTMELIRLGNGSQDEAPVSTAQAV